MEDRAVVELFLGRSEAAISEAETKYGRLCRSIARGILGDDGDAEECVNDALLAAWNSIPPAEPERLSSYLGRLTRNIALDRYDKKRAGKRGGGTITAVLDELGDCAAPGADFADEISLRDSMQRFLKALPTETRRIFLQRYWYMLTIGEIAAEIGYGESRVKMILKRTRDKLKKHLESEGIIL